MESLYIATALLSCPMRYHIEPPKLYGAQFGKLYICDHVVYSRCTLYKIKDKGLAVIQQRYDQNSKVTYWTEIDPDLVDIIYLNPKFLDFFNARATEPVKDIYPTVTLRQLMWALRMKPLKRERWETCFDHKDI